MGVVLFPPGDIIPIPCRMTGVTLPHTVTSHYQEVGVISPGGIISPESSRRVEASQGDGVPHAFRCRVPESVVLGARHPCKLGTVSHTACRHPDGVSTECCSGVCHEPGSTRSVSSKMYSIPLLAQREKCRSRYPNLTNPPHRGRLVLTLAFADRRLPTCWSSRVSFPQFLRVT